MDVVWRREGRRCRCGEPLHGDIRFDYEVCCGPVGGWHCDKCDRGGYIFWPELKKVGQLNLFECPP